MGFSLINHPFGGTPVNGTPHPTTAIMGMQRAIERENEDIHHRSSQYSYVKRFVYLGPEYQWAKKGLSTY